jgi:predicted nucleic acid-binding protein
VNDGPIVSNSSPLIALAQIDLLDLTRLLFGVLLIPPAVRLETIASIGTPAWIIERTLTQPLDQRIPLSLDLGECEAISLAIEVNAYRVIIDERPARRVATRLGLPVIGTLGILILAKERGLIDAVRPHAEALIRAGFYVAPAIYRDALRAADEA